MTEENAETSAQRPDDGPADINAFPFDDDGRRYCWVCFATDEDDDTLDWVQPCNCKGTTKWVHQYCIQRWVDEKLKGNISGKVCCPQCNTQYLIEYPNMGCVVYFLDTVDNLIYKTCPFVAAGLVVGSIYWTAVTYGAVTVMQVIGHKEGLTIMEQTDPLVLLVGLPTIPIMLILGKMVRWEDSVLALLRRHSYKVPILKHLFPPAEEESPADIEVPPLSDPVSATRVLCGALLFPSVATIVGKLFFDYIPSSFQRALLGGLTYIVGKGILKIYHKQQQFVRLAKRKILNFTNTNAKE